MSYMESKMQEVYDAQHDEELLYVQEFEKFANWCLRIPDFDTSLLSVEYWRTPFEYVPPNDTLQALWEGWIARAVY